MNIHQKSASYIKAQLIDFILDKKTNSIIGSEIMYGTKKRVVDILELLNGKTIAYEIKAFNDDFRKLPNQIEEYKKVFDYVYLVITSNHLSKINDYLEKNNVGIYLVDNDDRITLLKKATLQKSNNKVEILHTMNATFLKRQFQLNTKTNATTTREVLINKSMSTIKETLFEFLFNTISPRFNLFLNERGDDTLAVDVEILSLSRKKLLK